MAVYSNGSYRLGKPSDNLDFPHQGTVVRLGNAIFIETSPKHQYLEDWGEVKSKLPPEQREIIVDFIMKKLIFQGITKEKKERNNNG